MSNEADNLEERIAAYIDGQLPPAEAARLEVYLANTDAKLAEQVINMIGDRHRVQSLPKEAAPSDLAARIMEQVERTSLLHNVDQLAPPRRPWWQTRAAAAALLFLVLGGFTYYMLQALRPANPAWQAAMDTSPAAHPPTIAALPPEPASPAGPPPTMGSLAAAPVRSLEKDIQDKTAETLPAPTAFAAAAPAANEPLAITESGKPENAKKLATGPVTLAFVARDPGDFTRLQQAMTAVQSAGEVRRQSGAGGQAQFGMARAAADQESHSQALPQNSVQNQSQNETAAASRRDDAFKAANAQSNDNLANQQQPAATNTPAASVSSNFDTLKGGTNAAQSKSAPAVPVTYHVSLRPAEIATLIHQFRLAPPTAGLHEAATAPAPASAEHSRAALPAAAPATQPTDDRVDCIVTMTPPPTTQPAP